ncbi:MAG UNVERIFIED_CONTAM: hypothetical protein LVT10_02045 [Anaerolineae bacterium]
MAEAIQAEHGKPVLYYDGDVPAILPNMHGFASGFRIDQGQTLRNIADSSAIVTGGAFCWMNWRHVARTRSTTEQTPRVQPH